MARPTAQPRRDATGFLDTRDLGATPEAFETEWADDKSSSSLLRAVLDRVSDYSFVTTVRDSVDAGLVEEGLPPDLSPAMTPEVLRSPSFAVAKDEGELVHIRHAVIFGRNETLGLPYEVVICVDAWVKRRHVPAGEKNSMPGAVARTDVQVSMIDLEGEVELGSVMTKYLGWLIEFPAPAAAARHLTESVVFLGSPTALGCEGTPAGWRQQLTLLAQAFQCAAVFHHGPDFTGSVGANVRQVYRFEPYRGVPPVDPEGVELTSIDIDVRTEPYDAVFQEVAVSLANHVDPGTASPYDARDLQPGEQIYHRKVGNNRKYDNFDQGSPTPCSHGIDAFVRFGGDKSRKGMANRYKNFEASWLRHCSKFPNCNLYAVFVPGERTGTE